MVSKLDYLNLSVHDFDETTVWYGRIFGFTVVEEGIDDGLKWGVIQWPNSLAWYIKGPTGWEIEVVYWDDDTIRF